MFNFLKSLFKKSEKPAGCCGGDCCDHRNTQEDLKLTDEDMVILKTADPKIVVGKVVQVEPHPDPKITKVQITQVEVSPGNYEQILCGGTNVEVGIIVAVATVGAKLSKDFEIGVRAIRGEESRGMICARAELGLSANECKQGGIWRLPENYEKWLGMPVCEL